MTTPDLLTLIVGIPFAIVLGAWLGRKAQRRMWLLRLPYEERLKAIRRG